MFGPLRKFIIGIGIAVATVALSGAAAATMQVFASQSAFNAAGAGGLPIETFETAKIGVGAVLPFVGPLSAFSNNGGALIAGA